MNSALHHADKGPALPRSRPAPVAVTTGICLYLKQSGPTCKSRLARVVIDLIIGRGCQPTSCQIGLNTERIGFFRQPPGHNAGLHDLAIITPTALQCAHGQFVNGLGFSSQIVVMALGLMPFKRLNCSCSGTPDLPDPLMTLRSCGSG